MSNSKKKKPDLSTNFKHPPGQKFLGRKTGHVREKRGPMAALHINELASCYSAGAENSEVAPGFLKNRYTPSLKQRAN
jgi:hypothetical protein